MIAICFILLVLSICWTVYWVLVRPVILERIAADFARLQSQVDWAIIEGTASGHEHTANQLSESLENSYPALCLSISMLTYGMLRYRPLIDAQAKRDHEHFQDLPGWLRKAHLEEMQFTTRAALANSPVWWPVIAVVLLVAVFSVKVAKWWADLQSAGLYAQRAADRIVRRFARLQISGQPCHDIDRDNLRHLVGMQGAQAGFQRGVKFAPRLEQHERFLALLQLILPDVNGRDRWEDVDTRNKLFAHELAGNLAGLDGGRQRAKNEQNVHELGTWPLAV